MLFKIQCYGIFITNNIEFIHRVGLFLSILKNFQFPVIEMALKGNKEIFLALFMAQAFTSIVSIGLILLLTGAIKETKYGMSISRYIMEVKPEIFKHNYIILLNKK